MRGPYRHCGFADETNAQNFPRLNFSCPKLAEGVAYARARGAQVLVAINIFPRAGGQSLWHRAVADAHRAGVHAVILADPGLIAMRRKPIPTCACICRFRQRPPTPT
jgi:collagenase-like PrtC family protease